MLFAVSLLTGAYLPDRIPLHWDRQGVIDRIGSKYELIFLLPCASAVVFAIGVYAESRIILPSRKLRGFMSFIQFFFLSLIFVLQIRSFSLASDNWIPIERLVAIPILLLYSYISAALYDATYLSRFGVRTSYTLKDQAVWGKANRLASRLFGACAALTAVSLVFYKLFYALAFAPPILALIISAIYSRAISDRKTKAE